MWFKTATLVPALWLCVAVGPSLVSAIASDRSLEIAGIANSPAMPNAEKIRKIQTYFESEDNWVLVIYWLGVVDWQEAEVIALERFRDPATTRRHKLMIGRAIWPFDDSVEFKKEYLEYLIWAVQNGGAEEFLTGGGHGITAVGEYTQNVALLDTLCLLERVHALDPGVVPALIASLQAAEREFRGQNASHGPWIRGMSAPLRSIPFVLAKLRAVEAVGPLERAFTQCGDEYFRHEAAYALAVLMDEPSRTAFRQRIMGSDALIGFLTDFARGLLERGDPNGYECLRMRHVRQSAGARPQDILIEIERRRFFLRSLSPTQARDLVREMTAYEPLIALLETRDAAILREAGDLIVEAYRNLLLDLKAYDENSLTPFAAAVAAQTQSKAIRELSAEYLKRSARS